MFDSLVDRRSTPRRGAAAVEFAAAFSVLVLLIFGGIELTRVTMIRHSIDHAAYVAARDAIVPGATSAAVLQRAQDHLAVVGIQNAVITLIPANIEESTSVVEVRVTAPLASNSYGVPQYVGGDLVGRARLMTERSPIQMAANLPEPPPPPALPLPPAPPDRPSPQPTPVTPSPGPPSPPSPPPPPPPPPPNL